MTAEVPQEAIPFRCTRCGTVAAITVPAEKFIATLRRYQDPHWCKPPTPDCPKCGAGNWVRVGGMSEYYAWTRYHDDLCQVGDHRDPRTVAHRLVPRVAPAGNPPRGTCHVLSVTVGACPDHVEVLRTEGVLGCFLIRVSPDTG